MGTSWTRAVLNPMTGVLVRRGRQTERDHVTTAKVGVHPRSTWGPRSCRRGGRDASQRARGTSPADTVISDSGLQSHGRRFLLAGSHYAPGKTHTQGDPPQPQGGAEPRCATVRVSLDSAALNGRSQEGHTLWGPPDAKGPEETSPQTQKAGTAGGWGWGVADRRNLGELPVM